MREVFVLHVDHNLSVVTIFVNLFHLVDQKDDCEFQFQDPKPIRVVGLVVYTGCEQTEIRDHLSLIFELPVAFTKNEDIS